MLFTFLVEYSPFYGIEKGAVLQEARQFHNPQIEARKARQVKRISARFLNKVHQDYHEASLFIGPRGVFHKGLRRLHKPKIQ